MKWALSKPAIDDVTEPVSFIACMKHGIDPRHDGKCTLIACNVLPVDPKPHVKQWITENGAVRNCFTWGLMHSTWLLLVARPAASGRKKKKNWLLQCCFYNIQFHFNCWNRRDMNLVKSQSWDPMLMCWPSNVATWHFNNAQQEHGQKSIIQWQTWALRKLLANDSDEHWDFLHFWGFLETNKGEPSLSWHSFGKTSWLLAGCWNERIAAVQHLPSCSVENPRNKRQQAGC